MEREQIVIYCRREKSLRNEGIMNNDTVRLLRECDAGIKMGIAAIDDVLNYVHDGIMRQILIESMDAHEDYADKIKEMLDNCNDEGKDPNPVAKSMSWIKTNVKLVINESDETIADLITDGCNMGVKSLNKYLNQYENADDESKDIAADIIKLEEGLGFDMRKYL